jgi:NAD(P)H-dependent flavin oxidoreductase YrpB (nitropropane dioxygenase family)
VAIPGVLDRLAEGRAVELAVDVKGPSGAERVMNRFDPQRYLAPTGIKIERPRFLAIISTPTLATMLTRKANGVVDGFIIEGPTAGGHNAPPRGRLTLSEVGEPIYGSRDEPDLAVMRKIGRPFWLAGSYASPERVVDALADGAAGVQVGTAFAYCKESGLSPELRGQILEMSRRGAAHVFTDPVASPTGFPFKVVEMKGTTSSKDVYEARNRVCDLGYLRHAYRTEEGKIGLRCPSEPVEDYLRKGGAIEDTEGRKCVCNSLMANIDLGQARKNGYVELPLVTSGDDVAEVARFLPEGQTEYAAADVITHLLSLVHAGATTALSQVCQAAEEG